MESNGSIGGCMKKGTDTYFDIPLEVKVTGYKPSRPAPACSNPSSPKFSDSGDDCEYEIDFVVNGKPFTTMEELEDILHEIVVDEGDRAIESVRSIDEDIKMEEERDRRRGL